MVNDNEHIFFYYYYLGTVTCSEGKFSLTKLEKLI